MIVKSNADFFYQLFINIENCIRHYNQYPVDKWKDVYFLIVVARGLPCSANVECAKTVITKCLETRCNMENCTITCDITNDIDGDTELFFHIFPERKLTLKQIEHLLGCKIKLIEEQTNEG